MANDLTTVFLPLIAEDRMADHSANDLALLPRANDPGRDVQFQEALGIDPTIFMIAPGEVFLVLAGTTVTLPKGPTITAPAARHVVAMHVLTTFEWAPVLTPTGQPIAEWWAVEGIWLDSYEAFINLLDLAALAAARGYGSADEYRTAVMAGVAGVNVLLSDEEPVPLASLDPPEHGSYTVGLRAWATYDTGLLELDAAAAVATFKQLAPSLEQHPLLAAVLGVVSASDVTIHVRFTYWRPNAANSPDETHKGAFAFVPDGSRISLQKKSGAGNYQSIVESVVAVNGEGQVALVAPRADLNAVNLDGGEILLFRVDVPAGTLFTPQYQHNALAVGDGAPRQPPQTLRWGGFSDAWLTENRSTTDEAIEGLDFLVNYSNSVVGSSAQPIEYYAGVPVFLQITYPVVYTVGLDPVARFASLIRKAPKGITVEVRDASPARTVLGTFSTDEHGQIWGMLADATVGIWTPLEIVVKYEIEDPGIGLLKIEGEVEEGGNAFTSYSSLSDRRNAAVLDVALKCRLGKPDGGARATALLTVQVGFVEIDGHAVSRFVSDDGRHAGILHALQQVRYVHQWFGDLTAGFRFGGADESWAAALARHNVGAGTANGGAAHYNVLLPKVRVTEPKTFNPEDGQPNIDEGLQGEVTIDRDDVPDLRWWLILYGFDRFSMDQKVRVPDGAGGFTRIPLAHLDNRVQFWRSHTIWHEFTHAVINMAWNRLLNLDLHTAWVNAKNPSTSGRIYELIQDVVDPNWGPLYGGWSTLEEALAAVPEAALMKKVSGVEPSWDPAAVANPRFLVMDHDAAGVADKFLDPAVDLKLDDGPLDFNRIGGGAPAHDDRLGLRVPIAFTWALWTALEQVGAFGQTLLPSVTGVDPINELQSDVPYLRSAGSRQVFQSLFWGPLIASRTPDIAGAPSQWNDLTTLAPAPTTFSFITALQNNFWNVGLGAGDRTKIRDLFGRANNPESYYLWFTFP
jgi:hypothetical protein